MKKKIFILSILAIFVSFALLLFEWDISRKYISTFQYYITVPIKISQKLLQDYDSNIPSLKKSASNSIIKATLENLNYQHWQKYIDYIDLSIYKAHVLPKSEGELIVVLNLSKDLAVVSIYTLQNDLYAFSHKIEDILPIQNIQFISVPQSDYNFIITEQLLDERLGAFFEERFIEIFVYSNNTFTSAWKKTKYLNEIYNAQWVNPIESSEKWFQTIEDNQIEFKKNETVKISVSIHKQKRETFKKSVPSYKDFKPILDICTEESFYWNPKYQRFIIAEKIS